MKLSAAGALLLLMGVAQSKTFYIGWLDKWGGCWTDCGDVRQMDGKMDSLSLINWVCRYGDHPDILKPGMGQFQSCFDGGQTAFSISQQRTGFEAAWNSWLDEFKSHDFFWQAEPWGYIMPDEKVYTYPGTTTGPSSYFPNPLKDGRGFKSLFGNKEDHQIVMFRSDTTGNLAGTVSAALPLLDPNIPSVNQLEKCTLRSVKCLQDYAPRARGCEFSCEDWTGKKVPRQVDLILGPGKANYVREVASIIGFYGVPHMQSGANNKDAHMSDKSEYPLFLRPGSSFNQGAETLVSLLKQMEWNRVGMIYSTDRMGMSYVQALAKASGKAGITINAFGMAPKTRPVAELKMLKQEGIRIIIMACTSPDWFYMKHAQWDTDMMKGRMKPGEEDFTFIWPQTMNSRMLFESHDLTHREDRDLYYIAMYQKYIENGALAKCTGLTSKQLQGNLMCHMIKGITDKSRPFEFYSPEGLYKREGLMLNEYHLALFTSNTVAGDIMMYNTKYKSPKVAQFFKFMHHTLYAATQMLLNEDDFESGTQMAYLSVNGIRMLANLEEICTHDNGNMTHAELATLMHTFSRDGTDYSTSVTTGWTVDALRTKLVEEYYKENDIDPVFNDFGTAWTDKVLDQPNLCHRFNWGNPAMGNLTTKKDGPHTDASGKLRLNIYQDARAHAVKSHTKTDFRARGQILYSLMRDTWIDQLHDKDRLLQTGDQVPDYTLSTYLGTSAVDKQFMAKRLYGTSTGRFNNRCIYGRLVNRVPVFGLTKRAGLFAPANQICGSGNSSPNGQLILGYAGGTSFPLEVQNFVPTGGISRRKVGVSWNERIERQKLSPSTCPGCYWGLYRQESAVPLDEPRIIRKQRRISSTAKHIFTKFAVIGVMVCAFLLGFNFKLRNRRYIRMSSPNINSIIIVGIALVLIATYPMSFDTHDDINILTEEDKNVMMTSWCKQRVCFLCLGFSLAFEALFAKTYRVHKIFNAKLLGNVKVTDFELFQIVGGFLVVDVVLIICWFFTDPIHRLVTEFPAYRNPANNDEVIVEWYETCNSTYMAEWMGAMYFYKGVTLIWGAWLAWQTRNVEIPALNDSKWIGFAIYNVTIICVTMLPVLPFISYHPNVWFSYAATGISILAVGVLGLIFFPKVYTVIMNEDEAATQSQMTRLASSKKNRTTKWSSKASSKASSKYSAKSSVGASEMQSEMDTA